MRIFIAEKIRKCARQISADYADTAQFPYTNPGNDYPSDITYDTWPGELSPKENEPASKKDDEKKKWDCHYIGPGPTPTDWDEKGNRPTFLEDPEPPKTDAKSEFRNTTKPRGEEDQDDLNRETWVGEGIIDKFNF